jgi:acyl-[acyl-carrier-protein]-phospholipid O-acyltransferase/long-chain-fatty-acid--[acyl-carrier-protein] ligase
MRLKASLADLRFSAFLLAQALGALNDNAFKTFVALLAVSTNPSAAPRIIALAGGLFVLPFLLFSAIAGDAADRWSKSQLMRIFKGAEIVLLLIAVPALVTANVPSLLVLMFLMGTHSAFFGPIKFAILPEIVEEADLSQANGLVQMTTFGGIILGTMLAAELAYVCHGHPAVAPVLLAVIALVGYGASLLVPETAPARPDVRLKVDIFSRTWGNVRHLTQFPTISLATYALSFFWFVGAIFQMNLIVYVTRQMGLGEMACGQFQTALALGIGLGSFVAGRLSRGKVELGLVPLGAIGIVAFSFDLAFAAASSGRVIGDLLLVGLSAGFFAVPLQALIQQRSPIDERGRVISTGNFLCFVAILGASGVLWILDVQWHLSPAKVFIACALFSALVAMELLRRLPDFFLRLMLYPIAHGLYSVRVKGQSHVPMEGPVLLVSNHVSFVDAILVAMANQRLVRFLLYRQFYELPIIHYLFRAMGCIPVSSGDGPKAMIESFQRARKAMMGGTPYA